MKYYRQKQDSGSVIWAAVAAFVTFVVGFLVVSSVATHLVGPAAGGAIGLLAAGFLALLVAAGLLG